MVLAMLLDGVGDVAQSAYIVPVAGCIMILGIVVAQVWAGIRSREMQSQERLASIARGVPLPPTPQELAIMHGRPTADDKRRRANVRLAGIILLGGGLGLLLFFIALAMVLQVRPVLSGAAVALIPLGIGVAMLVDAGFQKKELERGTEETGLVR